MKTNLILSLAIVAMLFSCTADDTTDNIINDSRVTGNDDGTNTDPQTMLLSGTYTEDLTLNANNTYKINGSLIMASGTTLKIPAGMTIEALASGSDVYIAISQGAKIDAVGTQDNPIVLTSDASMPSAGDWGGVILLGKAPINSVTGTATATSEIASLAYGGQDANDNSGIVRHMRIEYSGAAADGQSENNGISFYGVGNGTVIDYIQIYECKDDGLEFFGGTVNLNYVSVVNAQDDSIDWTEGYTGTITNAYVKHGFEHDTGIEADGYNTDFSNAAGYFSKPTITNLTIVGLGSTSGNEAISLRAGTQGIFNNVMIEGFEEGFDLDGDLVSNPTGQGVMSGDLRVEGVTFIDVSLKMKNDTGATFIETDFILGDGNGLGTAYGDWGLGWTVQ